jgi:hypothetical protein
LVENGDRKLGRMEVEAYLVLGEVAEMPETTLADQEKLTKWPPIHPNSFTLLVSLSAVRSTVFQG